MMKINLKHFVLSVLLLCAANYANAQNWLYSVRPGDTLWDLCLEYTVVPNCWLTIGDENGVTFPRRIPPGTIIKFPVSWLKNIPEPVTITFIQGDVSYQLAGAAQAVVAVVGARLPIGTTVNVGADSSASLEFANQSVLVLEANSVLALDELSAGGDGGMVDSRLRLLRGAVTTKVPKREPNIRFEIETPAAVAAVRGTEFRVSSSETNSDSMRTEVLEGAVAVANTIDQQQVDMGFGLVAAANVPVPDPIELLPPPIFITGETPQVINLTINWEDLPGAERYRLDLLTDEVNPDLINSIELNETSYTWEGLAEECYQVGLRGIDSQLLQGMPEQSRICIVPPLARVDLDSDNIVKKSRDSLEVSWLAIEGISLYELEISYDENFNTLLNTIKTEGSMAAVEVVENKTHFFRIRAVDPEGVKSEPGAVGDWSPSNWDKIVAGIATVAVLLALL